MKYQLTSELSIEYFSLIYGVRLSTPMINAILLLNERIKQRVAFRHLIIISKLTPNIRGIEHDSYRVKLDKFDYIPLIYKCIIGIKDSIIRAINLYFMFNINLFRKHTFQLYY